MSTIIAKLKPMDQGVYNGISNAAYHGDKTSYSSTLIKKMAVPAEAKYYMDEPPEFKDVYRIGGAVHKWVLERADFHREFLLGISNARRSKMDKLAWAQWFTDSGDNIDGFEIVENNPAALWNGLFQEKSGLCMVKPEEIEMIKLMAKSVMFNPDAAELLSEGEAEQSVYWDDNQTGLTLKVRPDYLSNDFISDLKSIDSVHDDNINKSLKNLGYGISQAMYQEGVSKVTGNWLSFTFIYIEKKPPYQCRVIALDPYTQEAYYEKYIALKSKLADCLSSDEWPGLPNDLSYSPPDWVTR